MLYKKTFLLHPSDSSAVIGEAFGIDEQWENKVLDVNLPDELPLITLITGESGCGKTTLLRELGATDRSTIPESPLHQWAESDDIALRWLSSVGLNDASLFCLRYSALSDSQKARARIYALLTEGHKILFLDEFLATLDRETAKALAFGFQRMARREGIQVICATSHNDLTDYLRPDLIIEGRAFPSRWSIREGIWTDENPFTKDLVLIHFRDWVAGRTPKGGYLPGGITAGKEKYRLCRLAELHYKGKYLGGAIEYLFAYHQGREVGVLVGAKTRRGGMRIARVVVHPTYRGCGIGQKMIRDFLLRKREEDNFPVETVAAMAQFNPVFEKAGMTKQSDCVIKPPKDIENAVTKAGFKKTDWSFKSRCIDFCSNISNRVILSHFAKKFTPYFCPGGDRSLRQLEMTTEAQIKRTATAIIEDKEIAGRLLWCLRPHNMARYVFQKEKP